MKVLIVNHTAGHSIPSSLATNKKISAVNINYTEPNFHGYGTLVEQICMISAMYITRVRNKISYCLLEADQT
jgi:hypothetical protein